MPSILLADTTAKKHAAGIRTTREVAEGKYSNIQLILYASPINTTVIMHKQHAKPYGFATILSNVPNFVMIMLLARCKICSKYVLT